MKYSLLFIFFVAVCFPLHAESAPEATLQATLSVISIPQRSDNSIESFGKIQPGSKIKLAATVQNKGTAPNAPGKIFVRFVFPEPLANQPGSLVLQTESIDVPSITPGQEVALSFPTDQNWPSLFDFIKNDWGMRQLQAVMVVEGSEKVLGSLSVLFSAYYYEGPSQENSTSVPVAKPPEPKYRPAVTRNAQRPAGGKQFAKHRAGAVSKELSKK